MYTDINKEPLVESTRGDASVFVENGGELRRVKKNDFLKTVNQRIDQIIAMGEGLTPEDGELLDIRIPAEGFGDGPYPTAGEAVRAQVLMLFDNISAIGDMLNNDFKETLAQIKVDVLKNGTDISYLLEKMAALNRLLADLTLQVQENATNFNLYFGIDGRITRWYNFEGENSFTVGKDNGAVKCETSADNVDYKDKSGNVVFRIDSGGAVGQDVSSKQIKVYSGDADNENDEWAIRLGDMSGDDNNLDIVWIGG